MRLLLSTEYCVYHHVADETVFYVGSGRSYRPFNVDNRGPAWQGYISKHMLTEIDVRIVCWFETAEEARRFERGEIARLQPEGNLATNERNRSYFLKHTVAAAKPIMSNVAKARYEKANPTPTSTRPA